MWAVRVRAMQPWGRSREAGLEVLESAESSNHPIIPRNAFELIPNAVYDNPELVTDSYEESGDVESHDRGKLQTFTEHEEWEPNTEVESIQSPPPLDETTCDVALSLESDSDDADQHVQIQNPEHNKASAIVEPEEKYQCALLFYLQVMYHLCLWPYDVTKKDRHQVFKKLHKVI